MLRARCLWTTGWALSLLHQIFFRRTYSIPESPNPPCPHIGCFLDLHLFNPPPPQLWGSFSTADPLSSASPHLHTQKPAIRPYGFPSTGSRLATPWDLSLTGLAALWATPQLYPKPCYLRSFGVVYRPCQPLTTGQTLAKSPPQQGDAYITRARNTAGCNPGLC